MTATTTATATATTATTTTTTTAATTTTATTAALTVLNDALVVRRKEKERTHLLLELQILFSFEKGLRWEDEGGENKPVAKPI